MSERKEVCDTCKFCDEDGFCRRFPPVPFGIRVDSSAADRGWWPFVDDPESDWCGEWQPAAQATLGGR